MDKDTLVAALNNDLAGEFQAVLAYTTWSSQVVGPHRDALRAMFQQEIPDELGHAQFLSDKIVLLGGTPTTTPLAVPDAPTNRAKLEAILDMESQAVKNYTERVAQAEAAGEIALKVHLETMIEDETGHRDSVRMMLQGWNDTL